MPTQKYYYCRKCGLTIHESEVTDDADGVKIHSVKVMGYNVPLFHEVIEEP